MLENMDSEIRWTLMNPNSGNWYGLGWDQKRQILVASDARDYVQKSNIWMKYLKTSAVSEWKGGYITSHFYFF